MPSGNQAYWTISEDLQWVLSNFSLQILSHSCVQAYGKLLQPLKPSVCYKNSSAFGWRLWFNPEVFIFIIHWIFGWLLKSTSISFFESILKIYFSHMLVCGTALKNSLVKIRHLAGWVFIFGVDKMIATGHHIVFPLNKARVLDVWIHLILTKAYF